MKKKVSLLLALLMLILCVASCTDKTTPSESSVGETSDETSETSSETQTTEIQYETVVSIGKSYTASIAAGDQYPDSYGTELCDGSYASEDASYTDEKFSGYALAGGALRVEFDMKADSKRLYKFGISYLCTTSAGIGPIGASRVYYSNDRENWSRISAFFITPQFEEGTVKQAWLTLSEPIDAKYIRFDIRGQSSWLFLDELIIIADTVGSAVNSNYLQQLQASYSNSKLTLKDLVAGSGSVDRSKTEVLVSEHCGYAMSRVPDVSFPDSDAHLLTDGCEPGAGYESGSYVGFTGGGALNIDVKLGKVYEGLSNFSLSMYQQANLHYTLPYYVDVYISQDGKVFDRIGRVFAPSDLSVTNFTFALRLTKSVSAKVVRFALPETDSDCFLIEEAAVGYYGEPIEQSLYPEVVLPDGTDSAERPNASSKKSNLVAGLPYQISSGTALSATQDNRNANTAASAGVLTDGKYSPSLVYDNGYWNRTRSGGSRSVFFDLGYLSSVSGFKINYLSYPSYAITVPGSAQMYLSEDGKSWYAVGMAISQTTTAATTVSGELTLKKPVKARFVCITFPVAAHTYVDEIEVYGTEKLVSGTISVDDIGSLPTQRGQYAAPSDKILGGVTDLALIYYNIIESNEAYYLPYVAYLDKEGNIKDTMFDGYLFLPSTAGVPSGGYPYASLENPAKPSDWDYQFEHNFAEGQDFDALNKATEKVKKALSLPEDYKVKVYATIMYPGYDFSEYGGTEKYISDYMDRYLAAFAEAGYANLTFEGFYWFEEAIPYDTDPDTIRAVAALAESKGSQLFWIPYFTARGYADWSSYGFSNACMQPNYVFRDTVPASQLYNAANYIRDMGMGIEIEIDDKCLAQEVFFKRYMRYLGYGTEAGYMKDCIHMYYQGGSVYYKACYSESAMGRRLYDATYEFIKGTITSPEKVADSKLVCKDGILTGNLFGEKQMLTQAALTVSAEHGSVSVSANGEFVYIPFDGYTGIDSFSFHYSDYLTWSADTTVTITVE